MNGLAAEPVMSSPVETGNREQILHCGIGAEPQGLDPHVVTGATEFKIMMSLLEGLVSYNAKDLTPDPGVAESWEISADGLVYVFHLRKDAKWSNGDPVTAGNFVFSYHRCLSPGLGSPVADMLYPLKNAEAFNKGNLTNFSEVGVKALDDSTLQLTLETATPHLLSLVGHFSWFPVHPPTITKFGGMNLFISDWVKPGNYVGNGPFILKESEPGKIIVVGKSPTYWDRSAVRLKEVHYYSFSNSRLEEAAFAAGRLHITETVPLDRIDCYRTNSPSLMSLEPYLGVYYLMINLTHPPLDNVKVRRALSLSLNRSELVNNVTKGGETPAFFFTPPGTAGYVCDVKLTENVEEARKLLAEAGYPDGKDFPKIRLMFNKSDVHGQVLGAVRQMWKAALNIDIELVSMEWKTCQPVLDEKRFDIARSSWVADYIDPNAFLDIWISDRGSNHAGYSNENYDKLVSEARQALDNKRRYELFREAEGLLMNDLPVIPLYFSKSKHLVRPTVRGWYGNALDIHPSKHVYLEP